MSTSEKKADIVDGYGSESISLVMDFDGADIRIAGTAEAPLFVAADICHALGVKNPSDTITKGLDEDEAAIEKFYTRSSTGTEQSRELLCVTESGLYHLIFKSRKPAAKKFRRWVTDKVIPEIRKTGRYESTPTATAVSVPPQVGASLDGVTLPEWLAEVGLDLREDATAVEHLLQRVGRSATILRYHPGTRREADGFQRLPRAVLMLGLGMLERDLARTAPVRGLATRGDVG